MNAVKGSRTSVLTAALFLLLFPTHLLAEKGALGRASGEELSAAVGHYARSRALLVEAIREFDRGYKIADPDALIDSKRWRGTLMDRAKELERVLDPQPKASRGGIKFNADKRLLNEAKD